MYRGCQECSWFEKKGNAVGFVFGLLAKGHTCSGLQGYGITGRRTGGLF